MSDLYLMHYDPNKEIYMTTDAINLGLDAILLYQEDNGQLKAVAYASRMLLLAEKITDK